MVSQSTVAGSSSPTRERRRGQSYIIAHFCLMFPQDAQAIGREPGAPMSSRYENQLHIGAVLCASPFAVASGGGFETKSCNATDSAALNGLSVAQIRSIAHFRQSFQQNFPAIDSRAEKRRGRGAKKKKKVFSAVSAPPREFKLFRFWSRPASRCLSVSVVKNKESKNPKNKSNFPASSAVKFQISLARFLSKNSFHRFLV